MGTLNRLGKGPMVRDPAELWIRLRNGRSICERYNQVEMAEFMHRSMLERVRRGEALICFDDEPERISAEQVERIDLLIGRECPAHRAEKTASP
jgi:hypothetical protein